MSIINRINSIYHRANHNEIILYPSQYITFESIFAKSVIEGKSIHEIHISIAELYYNSPPKPNLVGLWLASYNLTPMANQFMNYLSNEYITTLGGMEPFMFIPVIKNFNEFIDIVRMIPPNSNFVQVYQLVPKNIIQHIDTLPFFVSRLNYRIALSPEEKIFIRTKFADVIEYLKDPSVLF